MEADQQSIHLRLRPTPPFRLDWTVWALRRRAMNAVDRWDGSSYQRAVVIDGKPILIEVSQRRSVLDITATGGDPGPATRARVIGIVERMLGIRLDLSAFYEFSATHGRMNELATRFRGMKPPRFESVFEGLANGVACQQLSLIVGITLLNRLAEYCGLVAAGGVHAFPRPEEVAGVRIERLKKMGYSGSKAQTLVRVARAISDGQLDAQRLPDLDNAECVEQLVALKGIGRWTAEYVLLRALGRLDVFPGDDVGGQNSLVRWLHLRKKLDYRRVQKKLGTWRAYGGLIFLHLLLKGLSDSSVMAE